LDLSFSPHGCEVERRQVVFKGVRRGGVERRRGASGGVEKVELKGIEVCRDRNRGVDGEKRTPGEKVIKE
jgi:hypothetical protein